MPLSPFSTTRSAPRRPVGMDMRPMTRQAMLVFAGIPAVLAALGVTSESPGSFAFGFWIGLLATSLLPGSEASCLSPSTSTSRLPSGSHRSGRSGRALSCSAPWSHAWGSSV
jgi:hypothetical protein